MSEKYGRSREPRPPSIHKARRSGISTTTYNNIGRDNKYVNKSTQVAEVDLTPPPSGYARPPSNDKNKTVELLNPGSSPTPLSIGRPRFKKSITSGDKSRTLYELELDIPEEIMDILVASTSKRFLTIDELEADLRKNPDETLQSYVRQVQRLCIQTNSQMKGLRIDLGEHDGDQSNSRGQRSENSPDLARNGVRKRNKP